MMTWSGDPVPILRDGYESINRSSYGHYNESFIDDGGMTIPHENSIWLDHGTYGSSHLA